MKYRPVTPETRAAREKDFPRRLERGKKRYSHCEAKLAEARTPRATTLWRNRLAAARNRLAELHAEQSGELVPAIGENGMVFLVKPEELKDVET